jgi:general stress protein YciG
MTDTTTEKRLIGFALMTPERRRAIASQGGRAVPDEKRQFSRDPALARRAGSKGGRVSSKKAVAA